MHFHLLPCMAGLAHSCTSAMPWEPDQASCWRDLRDVWRKQFSKLISLLIRDMWVSPTEISQACSISRNTQSSNGLMRNSKWCCFNPLGFGVVCYATIINWHTIQTYPLLGNMCLQKTKGIIRVSPLILPIKQCHHLSCMKSPSHNELASGYP